ncbi:MAG: GntR family transcriptional regulator [Treponema sp.]|nr:GntR family transcriptional regulator [Treponema sp.]
MAERIYQKTVVDQTKEQIGKLITSGLYKPGDKLPSEQELANQFGIGRSSIREALKIFQHLGILEARVPKGNFVNDRSRISSEAISWSILLGNNDKWEILELRQVIEEAAFLSLMTHSIRDKESFKPIFDDLEAEIHHMYTAKTEDSLEELSIADYNFHGVIIRGGGNRLFFDIYKTLEVFTRNESRKTYFAMKNPFEIIHEHNEMLAIMRSGNMEEAVARHSYHFLRIRGLLAPATLPAAGHPIS